MNTTTNHLCAKTDAIGFSLSKVVGNGILALQLTLTVICFHANDHDNF